MSSHSFHFDCGNSSQGHVGFCARVRAESPQEALAILREALPEELRVDIDDDRVEYLNVYFGESNVGKGDIDMVDDDAMDLARWEGDDGTTKAPSANAT
jgi:hypothetical protein